MDVVIRPAQLDDLEAIYSMLCDLEAEIIDRKRFEDIFSRNLGNFNIGYFVAEKEGKPVGMISCHVQYLLHHASPVAEIQEMFVDESYRSLGIGRALVRSVIAFATECGATQLEVTTNRIRIRTHHFYEREGFVGTHSKLVMKDINKKKDTSK